MDGFDKARQVLESAIGRGEVPSAVAVVGRAQKSHFLGAWGALSSWTEPMPVSRDTVYDLASLSKVTGTLPAVLKLIDAGELSLESKVGAFFSNAGWFLEPSLADATVGQLLTHSSGLPAWKPLFAWLERRQTAIANVLQTPLEHPPGSYVYSDLGFITLGAIVERVTGMRLDAFVHEQVLAPLGMTRTRYGLVGEANVAATEDCAWRGLKLQGVVHDENAFVLGGVAGHAGLFGTADDLALYAQAWLNRDARLVSEELLALATQEQLRSEETRRGLGWMLAFPGSSAGRLASPSAYGHTGFTGTSLWIDPQADWFAVLLTNRVHPSRTCGANIQEIRMRFHEAVAEVFTGSSSA